MKPFRIASLASAAVTTLTGCAGMRPATHTAPNGGTEAASRPQAPPHVSTKVQGISVSLRVLQQHMQHPGPGEWSRLANVCGLERVDAIVADKDDILLVGPTSGHGALHIEDFVLALRTAFLRYGRRVGNSIQITPLAVSIDPDPRVMAELDRALARRGPLEERLREFERIGAAPQKAVVYGGPPCRAVALALDCDVHLKRLTNGTVTVPINGWESLFDQAARDIRRDPFASSVVASMDRFWFTNGAGASFVESDGVAQMVDCPVVLKTEAEALHRGKMRGLGAQSEQASAFVRMFNARFDDLAQSDERYDDLKSMYRWLGWGAILKMRSASFNAERVLAYLLDEYTVPEVGIPISFHGLTRVEVVTGRRTVPGGVQEAVVAHTSCGGVSLQATANTMADATGETRKLATAASAARPGSTVLYWPISYSELAL